MSTDFSNLFTIEGKTALVTGGSRGIGEMIAAGFLSHGDAAMILGQHGNRGDRQYIRSLSDQDCSEVERAVYMAAVVQLPPSERNALYGRVRSDGIVIDAVIRDLLNERHGK